MWRKLEIESTGDDYYDNDDDNDYDDGGDELMMITVHATFFTWMLKRCWWSNAFYQILPLLPFLVASLQQSWSEK